MSVTISFHTDDELKNQAENVCQELGIDMETAFDMFLTALVRERAIPFNATPDHKTPVPATTDIEWEDYNPMYYDVMRETANRLDGRYLHLADMATTENEKEFWLNKHFDLHEEINSNLFPRLVDVQKMQADLNNRLKEALAESTAK